MVRGWLGVSIKNVADDPDTAKFYGYQGDTGVFVEETFNNTPASGKLHKGDVIVGFNGQPVADVSQLRNRVADTEPNTVVTLRVSRDQKEEDVKITLGDQPEDVTAMLGHGDNGAGNRSADESAQAPEAFGMTFKTLDADTAMSLGIGDVQSGAVIMSVKNGSAAADVGLDGDEKEELEADEFEASFRFDDDDLVFLSKVARRLALLTAQPSRAPEQAKAVRRAVAALRKLPALTPGISVQIEVAHRMGGGGFSESYSYAIKLDQRRIEISSSGSQSDPAGASESFSLESLQWYANGQTAHNGNRDTWLERLAYALARDYTLNVTDESGGKCPEIA